jgi:SAM-dependent methyltransferase
MTPRDTDREWERLGAEQPYYGVLTAEEFRDPVLDTKRREEFFRTGVEDVGRVMTTIRERIDPGFAPQRVLDFGCGVGRLVIPFARHAREVVGLDVSESMLALARRHCAEEGLTNVRFLRSDDTLSAVEGVFDLVHTYIVLQHIPVGRGEVIFRALVDRVAPGGVGALHFTTGKRGLLRQAVPFVKRHLPFGTNLVNLVRGRGFSSPDMEMNSYRLSRMRGWVEAAGGSQLYEEPTMHGGAVGVMLYFRKAPAR